MVALVSARVVCACPRSEAEEHEACTIAHPSLQSIHFGPHEASANHPDQDDPCDHDHESCTCNTLNQYTAETPAPIDLHPNESRIAWLAPLNGLFLPPAAPAPALRWWQALAAPPTRETSLLRQHCALVI
ncbi:MAG: hypothetical protein ACTHN5_13970 [Phycisphaerae bacterium]